MTSLPPDLRSLMAEKAEDLLCIYRKTLARIHGAVETVTWPLELLEPSRQSIPIRAIVTSPRQLDQLPDDPLAAIGSTARRSP
jgi:hypothetical protein